MGPSLTDGRIALILRRRIFPFRAPADRLFGYPLLRDGNRKKAATYLVRDDIAFVALLEWPVRPP
jgi:hypothetical protein